MISKWSSCGEGAGVLDHTSAAIIVLEKAGSLLFEQGTLVRITVQARESLVQASLLLPCKWREGRAI